MKIKAISTAVTSKVGRQILTVQKNSPGILFGAGVVGFVGTIVLATRATLKLDEVLKENEKRAEQADEARRLDPKNYSEGDKERDLKLSKVQTAIQVAKLYGPAFAVGVVSVSCLTGSHVILTKRNAAVTAAYAALDKGFREYRARVINDAGAEKDAEYRYGMVDKQIAVETDTGTDVKTVKAIPETNKHGHSIYAVCFDEGNPHWQSTPSYNQMFINSQMNWATDKLRANGHLFLNEVYDMLGVPRTKAGAVVGWVMDHKDENGNVIGDNYVDFGVFRGDIESGTRFVNGDEKSVWLDFNVDGIIYDLL